MHFAFLAAFFWLNTMCFNIWWTFRWVILCFLHHVYVLMYFILCYVCCSVSQSLNLKFISFEFFLLAKKKLATRTWRRKKSDFNFISRSSYKFSSTFLNLEQQLVQKPLVLYVLYQFVMLFICLMYKINLENIKHNCL